MSDETLTVILADDHQVVRAGLRMLLEADGIEVVAEAGTVAEVERRTPGHKPSVLVLDLNMPDGNALEVIPTLRAKAPDTAIVVLTMQEDPSFARAALQRGATSYVLKDAAERDLIAAVRASAEGRTYLDPELGARLAAAPIEEEAGGLTARERDVLRLIALGHTNREVGERLHLSVRTVETHRTSIQRKLGVQTRAELVRWAIDHGLLEDGQ